MASGVGEARGRLGVACVEVKVPFSGASSLNDFPRLLLRRLQSTVRGDDKVCVFGRNLAMVEVRWEPRAITPYELVERLARATVHRFLVDGKAVEPAVAVGLAIGDGQEALLELGRAALNARRASRRELDAENERRPGGGVTAVLTIDTFAATASDESREIRSCSRQQVPGSRGEGRRDTQPATNVAVPRHRRRAWRFSTGGLAWNAGRLPRPVAEAGTDGPEHRKTVVVIDPTPAVPRVPGLAAVTAASVIEGLGFKTALLAVHAGEHAPIELDGNPVGPAVLVLEGGRAASVSAPSPGAWQISAELTRWYRSAGVSVVALSTGAGAAAVAACAAEGAIPLFDMDQLSEVLNRVFEAEPGKPVTAVGIRGIGEGEGGFPPRFQALVDLTASERRVLFYMMSGWAAQHIANELVVSVTTVRSHIRSILRKLGVRSQLAAVAIAHGREAFMEADSTAPRCWSV